MPAYNEVKSIVRTLTEVRAYLARQTYSYEILVCADGNDGTREAAREFFAGSPLGRVLGSAERRGKGCGVREGVLAASGQIIGFTDADNKTPISEIEKVWDGFNQGCDVVIGSRGMSQSKIERHQPLYRRWGSKTFRLVMHTLTGLWLSLIHI